jgi:hypothetical protein
MASTTNELEGIGREVDDGLLALTDFEGLGFSLACLTNALGQVT